MKKLGFEEFDAVVAAERVTVVDFSAAWCGPCRVMRPVLEDVARDFEGHAEVVEVDADEEAELATRFGVRALPTLLFFRAGRVEAQLVGAAPRRRIEAVLRDMKVT